MQTSSAPASRPLGFFDGVLAFARGAGFIVGTPSVWPFAIIPAIVALILGVSLSVGGLYEARLLASRLVGSDNSPFAWLLAVLLGAVAVFVAFLIAVSLAQPLSGFALDRIVRAQEHALGVEVTANEPLLASVLRSVRVTLVALAIGLPLIFALTLVGIVVPPAAVVTIPVKVVVASLLLAWDVLDYPMSPRGFGVRGRVAWMRKNGAAVLGFGLAATAIMVIPFVGLLVLPMAVAGATRMTVASLPP
jgi:CysZ protein